MQGMILLTHSYTQSRRCCSFTVKSLSQWLHFEKFIATLQYHTIWTVFYCRNYRNSLFVWYNFWISTYLSLVLLTTQLSAMYLHIKLICWYLYRIYFQGIHAVLFIITNKETSCFASKRETQFSLSAIQYKLLDSFKHSQNATQVVDWESQLDNMNS